MRLTLTTGLLLGLIALPARAADVSARDLSTADAQTAAGLSAYWKLNFQEAESHFQAASDADPQNAAAVYYLGYTVYKIAEPKRPNDPGKRRAADLFARAYAIDPTFTPSWGVAGRRQENSK